MSSARNRRRRACGILAASAAVLALAVPSRATGPGKTIGGHRVGVPPLPRVIGPAGPTPLNPAGPTPVNPTGPSIGFPRRGVVVAGPPGVHVGVVGGGYGYGAPLGGSFFCRVHNRGYASESLFFEHLAAADGVYGDEALPYIYDDGGVWIFPTE